MQYQLKPGLEPLPGIGAGPFDEAEYLAREGEYMRRFEAGATTPRDRGIYTPAPAVEPEAGAVEQIVQAPPEPAVEAESVETKRPSRRSRAAAAEAESEE